MQEQHAPNGQEEHWQRADQLFSTWFSPCFNYAFNKLNDKHATEEVVMPVFTAIYNNPAITRKLQGQPPFPYLMKAISNGIADWWAQQAREKKRTEIIGNLPQEQAETQEQKIIRAELSRQLHQLIEKLSPQRRTVMRLTIAGYKSAEIAKILQVEKQTVRNIRAQSIKLMRTDAKRRGFSPWMLLLLS